jgi:hypothetical protein
MQLHQRLLVVKNISPAFPRQSAAAGGRVLHFEKYLRTGKNYLTGQQFFSCITTALIYHDAIPFQGYLPSNLSFPAGGGQFLTPAHAWRNGC